jgi:DNA invertase Pin-like site-specific DNA recombinase
VKRAALYLRQSVTRKDGGSVSIDTQRDLCTKWAESQGYEVVGAWDDPDTSGSKYPPEARRGWQRLVEAEFDVVVVHKFDRLARDYLAFWATVQSLQARGRTLASVSENIDLGSPTGKILGGVFAGLAEQTARDISERAAVTRQRLVRDEGRAVGGRPVFGWMNVPVDPEKPKRGMVLAQDPDRVGWVREIVQRLQGGTTVYGVARWLTEQGVEPPAARSSTWRHSTVERIARHPVLAGMIPYNPGNVGSHSRGDGVLRDDRGLPVVDPSLAVMSVEDWRRLVAALDGRTSPQSRRRADCAKTSSLLSGLVYCGDPRHAEPVKMWRGTTQGRPSFSCPRCSQTISNFEDVVVREFLRQKGGRDRFTVVEAVYAGGAAVLPEIEHRLDELDRLIRDAPREARAALQAEQAGLLDLRDERRAERPEVEYVAEPAGTFAWAWAQAGDDVAARRAVLDDGLAGITVVRGGPGRRTEAQVLARLRFDWVGEVGPAPVPDETWVD